MTVCTWQTTQILRTREHTVIGLAKLDSFHGHMDRLLRGCVERRFGRVTLFRACKPSYQVIDVVRNI